MKKPKRIQRRRAKGWTMPKGAVYVGRQFMSATDQIVLPGTRGPAPQRKARVYQNGRRWVVDVPTPYGRAGDLHRELVSQCDPLPRSRPAPATEVLMAPTVEQRRATAAGERHYQAALAAVPLLERNVVFYRGPSLLTGDPIVAIAVYRSSNAKTGQVVQTYILRADMEPIAAVRSGADRAICGDCALRGNGHGKQRVCYVTYQWAPTNLFRALHRTEEVTPADLAPQLAGLSVRLGAYGDPVAVPMAVWLELITHAENWTSYTHAWRQPEAQPYRAFTMASVDSPAQQREAVALGWRTFRVRLQSDPLDVDEVTCPASDEGDHRATCQTCNLCRGLARPAKSVAIVVHGTHKQWFPAEGALR